MSQTCEKHAALPVVGHSPCAGCEIERLRAENAGLHAQIDTLAERHASALCEIEALRRALKRIVKSTDGVFPVDHRISVHVSTIDLAKRTLWPESPASKDPLANPGQ